MGATYQEVLHGFRLNKTKRAGVGTGKNAPGRRPMKRTKMRGRDRIMVAYDLETSNIAAGTPALKYFTAFGADVKISKKIKTLKQLAELLQTYFLTEDRATTRYVAWNANGYDVFFVARALLEIGGYTLRPYLTRSKALRGLRVESIANPKLFWEFLDGMSMTGLDAAKMKLSKFLSLFAPSYQKLELDFSTEEFDASNKEHVAYAERDSEGLYYAMQEANRIVKDLTGSIGLQSTMGNLGIKYLQSKMPEDVLVWKAPEELHELCVEGPLKRGGYCWAARQYHGPVWKYDLNQAYAAAMRDCELPHGSCVPVENYNSEKPGAYKVSIERKTPSEVPFYYRDNETNVGLFTLGKRADTWLLSNEIEHLKQDKWNVEIERGYYWQEKFNLKEMVDELERLRFSDPQGPSGPLGWMVKSLGNMSFGKTLESLDGVELIMAREAPEGFSQYDPENENSNSYIWSKQGEIYEKAYHRPQIGCFITAHVRIIVRNAALRLPRNFLYADTDCVVFSRAPTGLAIDPKRYGAWKEEAAGKDFILIGKKIYHGDDGHRAKGLHIKNLSRADYVTWLNQGVPPSQKQIQRRNFVKFIAGQDMFGELTRRGTDVHKSKLVKLLDGAFIPC